MEAYLMLTSKLLKVHDTRAVQHTVRNIQSLLRTLMPSEHYQRFLANTILEAALLSYNDSYFAETQSELLDLISQIYSADTSGEAKSLFLRLPGVKESSLSSYEANLSEHKSARSKRQFTKELLAEIKGLAPSEQGRKQVDLGPDTSARTIMQKLATEAAAKAKRDRGDLLSQNERESMKAEEGAVLHLLFGNETD
jgi:Exportin-5 family